MDTINVIPIYKEIKERGPELVYSAVRSENTYLLESCEGGEKIARYSFIGFNPAAKLTVDNGKINFNLFDPDLKDLEVKGENPIEILRNLMSQFNITGKTLSRFFGGFVGYFSYDLVRYFVDLNSNTRNDLKEPDCEFILAKNNIIFDHKKKKTYLISHQFLPTNGRIDRSSILEELKEISESISSFPHYKKREEMGNSNNFSSNICKREFKENVERAKEYIYAGDIFQVVLSQRFGVDFDGDKFQVYSTLKRINPSPYMYYLDFGDRKIIGSSPEMLSGLKIEG